MDTRTTTGIVKNNEDPNMAGRIQVALAELSGQVCPIWIRPVDRSGWFWVPELEEEVEIEIPEGEDLIEFPEEMRYRGVVRDDNDPVHEDFQTNYPKRKGFRTPTGITLIIDDTPGSESIALSHKEFLVLRADKDGIFFGSADASEPFVLGTTLTNTLINLVDALLSFSVAGVQPGAGVSTGLNPATTQPALNSIKASLQGNGHLSDFIFGHKAP